MASQKITKYITIIDASNAELNRYEYAELFSINGTVALTQDWSLGFSGVPKNGLRFNIEYDATVTLNGHHINILGAQLPDIYASKKVNITATYNSAWQVSFSPSFDEAAIIDTANVIDEKITLDKLADTTSAYVLVGSVAGRPVFVEITGDVTITSTGVVSIGNAKIANTHIAAAADIAISKLKAPNGGRVVVSTAVTGILVEDSTTLAELQKLNGVVAGTATASKALVLGAGKNIDEIDITSVFKLGGVVVNADAADLNKLAGVTSSDAELNILDGVTAVTADLELLSGASVAGVTGADVLALENMASVLSFTADGIELKPGKVVKQTSAVPATFRIVSVSDDVEATDDFLVVDILGANLTLTLPAVASATGQSVRILIRRNTTADDLIITPNGADSIWAAGADVASHTVAAPAVDSMITVSNYSDGKWVVSK